MLFACFLSFAAGLGFLLIPLHCQNLFPVHTLRILCRAMTLSYSLQQRRAGRAPGSRSAIVYE